MNASIRIMLASLLAMAAAGAWSQQPVVYPAKGQSPQQQKNDEGQCYAWARSNTGIDPMAASQPAPREPAVGGGERVKGAAGGAIIGGIAGGHAGEGAAIGAIVGGSRARRNQAQQQQQAQSSQISTFNRAYGACMEGRGYTVR